MGLEKSIAKGEERRKPYYRSRRFDPTCRPGGSCLWCRSNRTHQHRKEKARADVQDREEP